MLNGSSSREWSSQARRVPERLPLFRRVDYLDADSDEANNSAIAHIIEFARINCSELDLLDSIGRGYYLFVKRAAGIESQRGEDVVDVCLKCVHMLRSCDYPVGDILCLFAVAASSLRNIFAMLTKPDLLEIVHLALAQVFLAHCWLFDEACPINEWHKHIFVDYCTPECLNGAVMKLFYLQGWKFSAPPALVKQNLFQLLPDKLHQKTDHYTSTPSTRSSRHKTSGSKHKAKHAR